MELQLGGSIDRPIDRSAIFDQALKHAMAIEQSGSVGFEGVVGCPHCDLIKLGSQPVENALVTEGRGIGAGAKEGNLELDLGRDLGLNLGWIIRG